MKPFDPNDFRLLVFDWDGTLMDSIGPIVACTQAVFGDLGLEGVEEEKIRGTIGLGLRESIDYMVPGCTDETFQSILERYRHHWVSTYRDRPVMFTGVEEMLQNLVRDGWLVAVATGKSRRGLNHVLDQTGLRDVFHSTRTVDEAFSKPHPKMLLDILDDLGVKAGEALMIGDTTFDLEMARSAGTASVGVCSGGHCREELLSFGPLACLEWVVELPAWLAAVREPDLAKQRT
ncbi:MAG TPA: HAD-IA family hydrolase [Thermoanaerobaculia bacterium]|jgi:phosphoglycolate phosphatase|nr:HAD-IA family hydrolase [Thermoanaerobaculia bacterium]